MHEHSTRRPSLSDILAGSTDTIRRQWNETEAAGDFELLPAGTYIGHVHHVELFNAKTGTPGVRIQFRIAEGDHTGRMLFHNCWLTEAALPQTKRDCAKLGLDSIDKLEDAAVTPGRIRCKVRVALRTDDNGEQHNRVRRFDVLGIDEPERDAFAPDDETEAVGSEPSKTGDNGDGIDAKPGDDSDIEFDPAKLDAELATEQPTGGSER